jgi:branched-chain amino acid transport system permease protein
MTEHGYSGREPMDVFLQLLILGITKGSLFALMAVSFGLIYFTTQTFHLAHGAVFVVIAYFYYFCTSTLGLPLAVAVLLSFPVAVILAVAIELFLYQRLRVRYASSAILLLSSLSILIVVPPILAIIFSANPLFFPPFPAPSATVGAITIPGVQLVMLICIPIIALLILLLRRTGIGKLMRAVADSERVAQAIGIKISWVRLMATISGSMLLVPVAILWGYDQGLIPSMGFDAILIASSCAIMGGLGNILGAAASGVIIGVAMRVGVTAISSQWSQGIAFLLLVIVLIFRPNGIFALKSAPKSR